MVTTSDGGKIRRRWTALLLSLVSLVGLVVCQQSVESGVESLVLESAPMLADSWIPPSSQAEDETNVTVAMAIHPSLRRRRRDIFHLYNMMTCATNCDPLSYKGYGCYCGFLGSGAYVDGIDRCCKIHDYCYGATACKHQHLIYFVPYKWKCNYGRPYCVTGYGQMKPKDICAHHLCECDRQFAECIRHYPCPSTKPVCISNPWRSLG